MRFTYDEIAMIRQALKDAERSFSAVGMHDEAAEYRATRAKVEALKDAPVISLQFRHR